MMRHTRVLAVGLLSLLAIACQPWQGQQATDKLAVEKIYASQHCRGQQITPRASWINSAEQLQTRIREIRAGTLGSKNINLPAVDFQHEVVLLVEMGQQPTAGYRLEMDKATVLRFSQDRASLSLDWQHPPANAIVAQMVSSPCLLLKLERGSYRTLQILDRQGVVRASLH